MNFSIYGLKHLSPHWRLDMKDKLQAAGCPADECSAVAAKAHEAGLSFDTVMKIYAWVQRYAPTLGVSCWNAVQELIAILKAPALLLALLFGSAAFASDPAPRPPQAPPVKNVCLCPLTGVCTCGPDCECEQEVGLRDRVQARREVRQSNRNLGWYRYPNRPTAHVFLYEGEQCLGMWDRTDQQYHAWNGSRWVAPVPVPPDGFAPPAQESFTVSTQLQQFFQAGNCANGQCGGMLPVGFGSMGQPFGNYFQGGSGGCANGSCGASGRRR